jgi:polar amino acid transport system substrate-binding protein
MNRLWAHQPGGGDAPICAQDHAALSAACLGARPFVQDQSTATVPGWAEWLQQEWGLDISVFFIPYAQRKLLTGLLYTLGLSISSILGAVLFGISLSLFAAALRRRARWLHIVLWPQEVLIRVARMVPPILQMYILFFGLGSVLDSSGLPSPGPFVSALIILVLYAGATCAAVLSHSFETALQHRPNDGVLDLFPDVFRTSYDGLVAACVNTVKAAGLASVIALPELVSSVNLIILEGGSATILMNGLVLFYLVLVLAVLKGFALLRASIAPTTGVRTQ